MRNHGDLPTGRLFLLGLLLLLALGVTSPLLIENAYGQEGELEVMTRQLIQRYGLNDGILNQLQFYLSEPLELEAQGMDLHREVPEDEHYLLTHDLRSTRHLLFKENLRGRCIELIPEHKKNPDLPTFRIGSYIFNWEPMRLHIAFDDTLLNYLAFVADRTTGEFVLDYDKSRNSVRYGGINYTCVNGCGSRKLLFYHKSESSDDESSRRLAGSNFPSSRPNKWLLYFLIGLAAGFLIRNAQ